MPVNIATYNPQPTVLHGVDARVKILLVLAYSIALFCVHSWWGIGVLALIAVLCAMLAKLEVGRTVRTLLPLAFILVATLLANSFVLDVRSYDPAALPGAVSAGIFADLPATPLLGAFGFVPSGFIRGCYYVLRIVLLLLASLVFTTTTSSTEITQALKSFLRPLESFRVPTNDIATAVSIALRFIPVTMDEFQQLRSAQVSRGAQFNTGKLMDRVKVWVTVLIPLFVGLYRRADNLALAMDARCYGTTQSTQLTACFFGYKEAILLVAGLAICILVAVFG